MRLTRRNSPGICMKLRCHVSCAAGTATPVLAQTATTGAIVGTIERPTGQGRYLGRR